jgi:biopolymer transport protein TolR
MGMAMTSTTRKSPEPDINVTPLVDVCLVLLIIFMVIAPQMENGERCELPGVTQVDKNAKSKLDPITVTLGETGGVYLEKDAVTLPVLEEKLKTIHDESGDRKVVLRGDANLSYSKVRDVFEMARRVGFTGVSLAVGKKGSATPDEEAN